MVTHLYQQRDFEVNIAVDDITVAVASQDLLGPLSRRCYPARSSGKPPPGYKKIVLNKVSINCLSSEATLLLGPSGCGKTTLLNVIAGRHDSQGQHILSGKIRFVTVGHADYTADDIQQRIGYVPQVRWSVKVLSRLDTV